MTAQVVNQDHFTNDVVLGGGAITLDMETFDTPSVIVLMRVLVDAADPADVAAVNAIQDGMMVTAASSKPFISPDYDQDVLAAIIATSLQLAAFMPDSFRMFGTKEEVGSRFALATIRTFVNVTDPADIKAAQTAQDTLKFSGGGTGPLDVPD